MTRLADVMTKSCYYILLLILPLSCSTLPRSSDSERIKGLEQLSSKVMQTWCSTPNTDECLERMRSEIYTRRLNTKQLIAESGIVEGFFVFRQSTRSCEPPDMRRLEMEVIRPGPLFFEHLRELREEYQDQKFDTFCEIFLLVGSGAPSNFKFFQEDIYELRSAPREIRNLYIAELFMINHNTTLDDPCEEVKR